MHQIVPNLQLGSAITRGLLLILMERTIRTFLHARTALHDLRTVCCEVTNVPYARR